MILNVNKNNFFIYLVCLITGLLLIAGGVISFLINRDIIVDEILISIGCSTIPTVVTAYFIDQANEKRNKRRILQLRENFLLGFPCGLLWIMKVIIEHYLKECNNCTIYSGFKEAIELMKSKYSYNASWISESEEIKSLKNDYLGYGVTLCVNNCTQIVEHNYDLQINGIFKIDELLIIKNLRDDCENISKIYRLAELAEHIDIFVNYVIEAIPEIKQRVSQKIVLNKGRISNRSKYINVCVKHK